MQLGRKNRRLNDIEVIILDVCRSLINLEEYSGCHIAVETTILVDDGAVQASCVNSAICALVDADISLREMATAVSLGYIHNKLLVDLLNSESVATNEITLTFGCTSGNLVGASLFDQLKPSQIQDIISIGKRAAGQIAHEIRNNLKSSLTDGIKLNKLLNVASTYSG